MKEGGYGMTKRIRSLERLRKGGGLERLALLEPRWTRHSELLGKQAKIVFITLGQLVSHPKTSLKLSAYATHPLTADDAHGV